MLLMRPQISQHPTPARSAHRKLLVPRALRRNSASANCTLLRRFEIGRQELLVVYHARVDGLHLLELASSLLRLDESEATMALPHTGSDIDPDVVLLPGLQVQVDLRLLVVGPERVLTWRQRQRDVAPVLQPDHVFGIAVNRRPEGFADELFVSVNVDAHIGRGSEGLLSAITRLRSLRRSGWS